MEYRETITLRDGRTCVLRNGTREDGKAQLDLFVLTHGQTDWLYTYPDETELTAEDEANYLQQKTDSTDEIELLADVDGRLVGSAGIEKVGSKEKARHRATFGISVDEAFWGQGIGSAMMRQMLDELRRAGYARASLSVQKENPALRLYERLGFEIIGDGEDETEWLMTIDLAQ